MTGAHEVLAAGRAAWARFSEAQGAGRDQLLDMGRALLEGRRACMEAAGADRPAGARYNRAFGEWCSANGFGDVPVAWHGDLAWCVENETEVRSALAAHAAIRRNPPSVHPRTMRQSVMKVRKVGAPTRRRAPTVADMETETLCGLLRARLDVLSPEKLTRQIARIAAELEDSARSCGALRAA